MHQLLVSTALKLLEHQLNLFVAYGRNAWANIDLQIFKPIICWLGLARGECQLIGQTTFYPNQTVAHIDHTCL